MEATVETLSSAEALRLRELEALIERDLLGIGRYLGEINKARLYRQTHRRFEEYVNERWDLERTRAYALMQAASVADAMSEKSDIPPPRREAHAKALNPLLRRDPDAAVALWTTLRERYGKGLTARHIRAAVNTRFAAERGRIRRYGSVARQPQLRLDLNPWDFDRELRRLEDKLPRVRSSLALVVGGKAERESLRAEVESLSETAEAILGYLDSGGLTDVASGLAPVPPRSRETPTPRDRNEFAAALSPGRGKPE